MEKRYREANLEDVDVAVYAWLLDEMDIHADTKDGFVKVPVLWTTSERAAQIKMHPDIRTALGTLELPLITAHRSGINKDLKNKGGVWGNALPVNDEQGGVVTIYREINHDKTSNFANAGANTKYGGINWPYPNKRIVYKAYTIPLPIYVEMTYEINIRTEFQQQMNEILQPFLTRPGGVHYYLIQGEKIRYEAFMNGEIEIKNTGSSLAEGERLFEGIITLRVLGILIGDDKNHIKKRFAVRENPVEVRMPRDRSVYDGDDNE